MSEQIKKGDLVRVSYGMPCCGNKSEIHGEIFVVTEIGAFPARCGFCKRRIPGAAALGMAIGIPVTCATLQKLDPPSEGEYERADTRIKDKVTV